MITTRQLAQNYVGNSMALLEAYIMVAAGIDEYDAQDLARLCFRDIEERIEHYWARRELRGDK